VSTVEIRVAGSDEADLLIDMYEWLFTPPGSRPPRWNVAHAMDRLQRAITAESALVLIAELDGQRVGLCTVYEDIESVRFGRRAWLEDLVVDPAHRSRGVGKRLLDEAKRWARTRGAARLQLDSGIARVEAHRFYEREHPSWRSLSFGWDL